MSRILMMQSDRKFGTMAQSESRSTMTRSGHYPRALLYRRMHRIRQRQQIRDELELLRAVAAVLCNFQRDDGSLPLDRSRRFDSPADDQME